MYKSVSFSSFGATEMKNTEAWRNKIEVPVFSQGHRKGPITLKFKPIIAAIFIILCMTVLYFYAQRPEETNIYHPYSKLGRVSGLGRGQHRKLMSYNNTYPLTKPVTTNSGASFRIGLITDMDTMSKHPSKEKTWRSILRFANLGFDNQSNAVAVDWKGGDEQGLELTSSYAYKGRGMELSELVVFNGGVYSVDDRTGIIYEIIKGRVAPWVILSDGDGHETKGFKGEWMTVKDEKLYVGGLGKEWTTANGVVQHSNPQWIKIIDKDKGVTDVNWIPYYKAMQRASGYESPGYIIHESAVWSDVHKAFFFLPRRASHERYDEKLDELRAANLLFKCSEDFEKIEVKKIGKIDHPARGYSSFKFLPGSKDEVILALKTEEVEGKTKSYITAFNLDGKVLMPDTIVSLQYKYEGVEFL